MGKVKDGPRNKGGNDNNAHIDKIICNQDVGKKSFGFIQQIKHHGFLAVWMLFQLIDVVWPQTEIGHFRSGDHGRKE